MKIKTGISLFWLRQIRPIRSITTIYGSYLRKILNTGTGVNTQGNYMSVPVSVDTHGPPWHEITFNLKNQDDMKTSVRKHRYLRQGMTYLICGLCFLLGTVSLVITIFKII
jgi:hypothetical protein